MSDAEKIAREIVQEWMRDAALYDAIATALLAAEARGYTAAREQAAGLAETHRQSWYPSADGDAACRALTFATRKMEPNT